MTSRTFPADWRKDDEIAFKPEVPKKVHKLLAEINKKYDEARSCGEQW